jgi:hypothetical protein
MNVDNDVLIQLQCSVDDETFMAHMNAGSSFSHSHFDEEIGEEEGYVVDEHGEGMIELSRGGRTANYTMEEDRLLCRTWLQIGMDLLVGMNQSRDTYWMRMKDYFDAHNPSGNERTDRSLRSRCRIINTDCQKMGGCFGGG